MFLEPKLTSSSKKSQRDSAYNDIKQEKKQQILTLEILEPENISFFVHLSVCFIPVLLVMVENSDV